MKWINWIATLCIATIYLNVSAQSTFGTSIRYQTIEPFHVLNYEYHFENGLTFYSDGGYGLRTTILQNRPHLGFGIAGGYNFIPKASNFNLSVVLRTGFSGYRLSPSTSIYFSEFSAGYSFSYGDKWKLLHAGFVGRTFERMVAADAHFSFYSWIFSIGVGYAL
jgi:hypothetical protein